MKKILSIFLISFMVFSLVGCTKYEKPLDKDENIGAFDGEDIGNTEEDNNQVSIFQATVTEINNNIILVKPVDGSMELNSSDKFSVLNKEELELQVGDLLEISYNGDIMETYPARLGEVYEIILLEKAEADTLWDRIPMVRVNGKLYYDTGRESLIDARCGVMDGEIISEVDGSAIPIEDNQSNFGSGFGYQYGFEDNTIEIYMNDKWCVFESREEDNKEVPIIVETFEKTTEEADSSIFVTYYKMSDDTYMTEDGYTYKYKLEITGRMGGAVKDSTFVYLSNIPEISFEKAFMAAGFSSNLNDYFDPEEAKFVGWK